MQIPDNTGQVRQVNIGDYLGEIWESFNLDLSSIQGKIKTSKQLKKILTESQMGGASAVVDLLIWDGVYILCTEDSMYTCSVTDDPTIATNWINDGVSSDLDLSSSAVVFDDGTNNRLRIALDTDIAEWNGGGTYDPAWWTGDHSGISLVSLYPHIMTVVQSQKATLYVTDKNRVQYYEKGATSTQIVQLDSNMIACCLASGLSGAMWVGTYNETSGDAYVYEIYTNEEVDGTPVYRQAYPIDGRAVLAIWVQDNTPFILNERGIVYKFNGVGFSPFAHFPFQFDSRHLDNVRAGLIQASSTSRPVHPRGVKVKDGYTYILINTISEEDSYAINNRSHSGVWELNNTTGSLSHKFAAVDGATDVGADVLTRSGPLLIVDNEYTFALAGLEVSGTNDIGMYSVTNTFGTSYFVTPEVLSSVETDSFLRVIHKACIKNDGVIYTLYRSTKRDTARGTINWTGTTTFTTTDDWSGVVEGDLVRISHGYGAGQWAMIESIEHSSTVYTVTVSKAIGLNTEISYAYSDNFNLAQDTYVASDGESKRVGLDVQAPWIQIMVILEGNIEYRMFDLVDTPKSNRK
jgi:hypothetical protein